MTISEQRLHCNMDLIDLLDGPGLLLVPQLAEALGLDDSVALRLIHCEARDAANRQDEHHYRDGRWWVQRSYAEWAELMRWRTERGVRSILIRLRKKGVVIARDDLSSDQFNHTLWYTIDYDRLEKVLSDYFSQKAAKEGLEAEGFSINGPSKETYAHRSDTKCHLIGTGETGRQDDVTPDVGPTGANGKLDVALNVTRGETKCRGMAQIVRRKRHLMLMGMKQTVGTIGQKN
jgi:hypothetical protein